MNLEQLKAIGERICTQDNRITENPMFCLQILRRDVGLDSAYAANQCWRDSANDETIYDDDSGFMGEEFLPAGQEWDCFGYVDRWETIMVAFTEKGIQEHLKLDGHNVVSRAFRGQYRIYVESFNRCPEMIGIREFLKNLYQNP